MTSISAQAWYVRIANSQVENGKHLTMF